MKKYLMSEIPTEAIINELLQRNDAALICVGNEIDTINHQYSCTNAFKGNEKLLFDMINRAIDEINEISESNDFIKYDGYLQ